jgi:RNA polymerase sigma-70 factor, ECF subfamily
MQEDEVQLVRRAINGDSGAFAQLVSHYRAAVYGRCYQKTRQREEAADLAQEAFLNAFLALGQLRDPAAFPAWLWRVTEHVCATWRRRPRLQLVPLDTVVRAQPEQDRELSLDLRQALAQLSDETRSIVLLHHVYGYAVAEVGNLLAIPVGTVKSRLHQARKRLQEELMDEYRQEARVNAPGEEFDRVVIRAVQSVQALDPAVLGYLRQAALANLSLIEGLEQNHPAVPRRVWSAQADDGRIVGVMICEDFREPVPDTGLAVELRASDPAVVAVLLAQLDPEPHYLFLVPAELREALLAEISEAMDFKEYAALSLSADDVQMTKVFAKVRKLTPADLAQAQAFPPLARPHEPTLAQQITEAENHPDRSIVFGALTDKKIVCFAAMGQEVENTWGIWLLRCLPEYRGQDLETAVVAQACRCLLENGCLVTEPSVNADDEVYLEILAKVGFKEISRTFSCRGRRK